MTDAFMNLPKIKTFDRHVDVGRQFRAKAIARSKPLQIDHQDLGPPFESVPLDTLGSGLAHGTCGHLIAVQSLL